MVWFGGAELEKPPLSAIMPRLYLGEQGDVTQERLAALDISHVLSVSRCSPQPSFLPASRFLRVPIDDSLSAELLPWIPQALAFIDSALASGGSVLVHCAAGISRSPALTVAYVMHRMQLDLDQAYRFVKERRPSISPNLNFLGQLQHFQTSLKLGTPLHVLPEETSQAPPDPAPTEKNSPVQRLPPAPHGFNENLFQNSKNPRAPCSSLRDKRKSLTLCLTPQDQGPPRVSPGPPPSNAAPVAQSPSCPRAEAKEALLSPLSLTLNRLLSWGERVLLAAPVRMGQPALPYRC
ncbi:unnamed protein product [Knipowitschia caucasica]|uniref:protein-tyrosine-phosphatase n=1 Tax=Knipowitschia caucasica TaxID=637954 RepID=A0AAV2M1G2_KNICA